MSSSPSKTNLDAQHQIVDVTSHVAELVQEKISFHGGIPPNSALDQAGIVDGEEIIKDYVQTGAEDMAVEHLEYIVTELDLDLCEPHRSAYSDLVTNWIGPPSAKEPPATRTVWGSVLAFFKF